MATMAFSAYGGRGTEVGALPTQVSWGAELLTLEAVKVNMGRKMMDSLASGIWVQTAASTAMMAPD